MAGKKFGEEVRYWCAMSPSRISACGYCDDPSLSSILLSISQPALRAHRCQGRAGEERSENGAYSKFLVHIPFLIPLAFRYCISSARPGCGF